MGFGLMLDRKMRILSVSPGVVSDWNADRPPSEQVSICDRIIAVNGVAATMECLTAALVPPTKLSLQILGHRRFSVLITKPPHATGGKLGLRLRNVGERCIEV